ncbi:NADP-dependent oxidoreductase [Mycobacteroides chelonae]|uniref:NADP-dependent oxidoreductase n=1 Tax=Mycobacteroides chelonae TaxID=1774 RepID=UPI0018B04858|nr:NADP-dependent oxidoreductase [Mycobacteroides chelonae]MBF9316862.1 NADP-dependent oxidoreductase [Mycobacteroides chelonae]
MRAVGFTDFGGPEVMKVLELPEPHAGPGEVRLRVVAADVNPSDTLAREGLTRVEEQGEDWFPHSDAYTVGWDAAGFIDEVGPGAERLSVGEPAIAITRPSGKLGGQAEYVVVPAASVAPVPTDADLIAWSTLLMNALTARLSLDKLNLGPGATVAVTGAAGAVGGYAVQIAKARGLTVIADAADKDRELVRSFGADHLVPRGDAFAADIRAIVPNGADGVVDSALLNEKALGAVRDGGSIASLRPYEGSTERGVQWTTAFVNRHMYETAAIDALRDMAAAGILSLRVGMTFTPEQAALAHQTLAKGGLRGRPVLVFDENYPNPHNKAA